jgi:hypothetical protein
VYEGLMTLSRTSSSCLRRVHFHSLLRSVKAKSLFNHPKFGLCARVSDVLRSLQYNLNLFLACDVVVSLDCSLEFTCLLNYTAHAPVLSHSHSLARVRIQALPHQTRPRSSHAFAHSHARAPRHTTPHDTNQVDKEKDAAISAAFGDLGRLKPPAPAEELNDRLSASLGDLNLFGRPGN